MEIGPILLEVASYFTPREASLDKAAFDRLTLDKKITTIFLSAISNLFFFIGALETYRLCLKQISVISLNDDSVPSDTALDELELDLDFAITDDSENAWQIQPEDRAMRGAFPIDLTGNNNVWPEEVDGL